MPVFEHIAPIEPVPPLAEEQKELLKCCRTFRKYEVSQVISPSCYPRPGLDELFALVPESEAHSYVEQLKKNARRYPGEYT